MVERRTFWTGLSLIVGLMASGCALFPPSTPERLPRIESYQPSAWDRAQLQRELAESARPAGLENPPQVDVVAWQNPDTAADAVVRCLQRAGVPAFRTREGYEFGSDDSNRRERALANYICSAQYPVRRDIDRPVTDAEVRMLQRHLVDSFLPCADEKLDLRLTRPAQEDYAKALRGESPDPVLAELTHTYDLKDAEIHSLLEECALRPQGFREYER